MLQQMHSVLQQVRCGAQPQTIPEISIQPAKITLTSEVSSQKESTVGALQCYARPVMQGSLSKLCHVQTA